MLFLRQCSLNLEELTKMYTDKEFIRRLSAILKANLVFLFALTSMTHLNLSKSMFKMFKLLVLF